MHVRLVSKELLTLKAKTGQVAVTTSDDDKAIEQEFRRRRLVKLWKQRPKEPARSETAAAWTAWRVTYAAWRKAVDKEKRALSRAQVLKLARREARRWDLVLECKRAWVDVARVACGMPRRVYLSGWVPASRRVRSLKRKRRMRRVLQIATNWANAVMRYDVSPARAASIERFKASRHALNTRRHLASQLHDEG